MSEHFPQAWIHGAPDCRMHGGPIFQVHPFDDSTFIIRQSKCAHYEGPFLYLLVGEHTAFMLDSGAAPLNGAALPILDVVESVLTELATARGQEPFRLVVGHSHSHDDHFGGDDQLAQRPGTTIVSPTRDSIMRAYDIEDWAEGLGSLDLGGRNLTIIPTPGHDDQHICVYDPQTGVLLSGDILYPGKLVINNWPDYRHSAARLAAFMEGRPFSFILGAHVEMKNRPGKLYTIGETYQPDEHVLQLLPAHLGEWAAACRKMGPTPRREVHADFVLSPGGI